MDHHIDTPLFVGARIYLDAYDLERDPVVESGWTHDPDYLHLLGGEPAMPFTPSQVRKQRQTLDQETGAAYLFAIRLPADARLIGTLELAPVQWALGNVDLKLAIGLAADRGKGYGSEALQLGLQYAFTELNLFRITVKIPDYNFTALKMLQDSGFIVEVRLRKAILKAGDYWDGLILGLLREDWERRRKDNEGDR